jgi:hypothetical protein
MEGRRENGKMGREPGSQEVGKLGIWEAGSREAGKSGSREVGKPGSREGGNAEKYQMTSLPEESREATNGKTE